MLRRDLSNSLWTAQLSGDDSAAPPGIRGRSFPASIPGCIHTDLIRAGIIGHPRLGMNELECQWVGRCDWEYRSTFDVEREIIDTHARLDLVFDGLDTIAEITLNGHELGRAANMFHPHRFDARNAIKAGPNELTITFRSPLRHIRAEEARLGPRPYNGDGLGEAGGWQPFQFIRKAACNFGWDWGPRVATCGVWKPIRIEAWSGVRISAVRPLISRPRGDRWQVDVHVSVDWSVNAGLDCAERVSAIIDDGNEAHVCVTQPLQRGVQSVCVSLLLDNPELWWPRGFGAAKMYPLEVGLSSSDRPDWSGKIAFREVRLNTDADQYGSKFQLEVNGKPIFCKGANWIPEGLFPDDRAPGAIRERLQQAAGANMNMLRVWGGGFYESDEFYTECDRLGLMVWQDFMFACALYPEEPPFPALVEAEARHQITRLSPHPSIVLWCGGNECTWGYESWGWERRLKPGQTWGAGYWFDLLPRLVRELDPTRPYWPASPGSGMTALRAVTPNDPDHGDRHTWDATLEGYRTLIPRFISEVGHQSPSNIETLRRALKPEELSLLDSGLPHPALEHRQRATGGTARHINESISARASRARTEQRAAHEASGLDAADEPLFLDWHTLAQQLQGEALAIAIDWAAQNQPRCMGILIWQFNEAWPGFSWSLIDSDGRPKPAYSAVQRAFARAEHDEPRTK
ncbi:MAG: glycoside hydrolase family 2 protein [Phycisphaerales bacterium]|nr:glycoside hydrolase family 2 protein [Phycisphaerales bacterium]